MMVGLIGMLNGAPLGVDPIVANRTLQKVMQVWQWRPKSPDQPVDQLDIWGWDYPLVALSAVRLGWDPGAVVAMLLMDSPKNVYLRNGHNYQEPTLPCYLPGNGGLLSVIAMMCAGFEGGAAPAGRIDSSGPGFPAEWQARCEGFRIAYP